VDYMTEQERLEESLKGWASDMRVLTQQRDLLVTHAIELGVTKQRIYQLTGIARTTIDRIIKGGHRRADHEDCECVEELDHGLFDCDCPGYALTLVAAGPVAAQHTYTAACDGHHAPGPCPGGVSVPERVDG